MDREPQTSEPEHRFLWWGECAEGTKEQLQAAGIGVDQVFPGEEGGPDTLVIRDRLGFEFSIGKLGRKNVYSAYSRYTSDMGKRWTIQRRQHAPGVTVYPSQYLYEDVYVGKAEDLIACGLASLDEFPGQAAMKRSHDGKTITKLKSGRFRIDLRVSDDELKRRRDVEEAERKAEERRLAVPRLQRIAARKAAGQFLQSVANAEYLEDQPSAAEIAVMSTEERRELMDRNCRRHELRQQLEHGPSTIEQFREAKAKAAEHCLAQLWVSLFCAVDGPFKFRVRDADDEWDDIGEAFGLIRDAIRTASVVRDKKAAAELEQERRIMAAKSDLAFRAFIARASIPVET